MKDPLVNLKLNVIIIVIAMEFVKKGSVSALMDLKGSTVRKFHLVLIIVIKEVNV